MPSAIESSIKTRVIRQWLAGYSRSKIAIDNDIGEGTVGSIVNYFKIGLDQSEFDSARELALQAKKQGLNLSDLASNFRLHNFIKSSGAAEDKIESFIANVSTNDASIEKVIELLNQLFNISKTQSIPLDQVSGYIREKLEQKQKIDEEIKQADAILQSKNVSIEAINEHIQLKEELRKHGLSSKHIHKLLNLLLTAKEYRYSPGKIVAKLRSIKRLENKENRLKNDCILLSKQLQEHKEILPLTEDIAALGIGFDELIALKVGISQAAKHYNLPPLTAKICT
jgi:hypothetical protein